jgi:hypothetical protein
MIRAVVVTCPESGFPGKVVSDFESDGNEEVVIAKAATGDRELHPR